jgi:hypothetical protein
MADKPVDQNHALLTGMVWGAFMKAGIPAFPVLDSDGDYTSDIQVNLSEVVGEPLQVTVTVRPRPGGDEPGL